MPLILPLTFGAGLLAYGAGKQIGDTTSDILKYAAIGGGIYLLYTLNKG